MGEKGYKVEVCKAIWVNLSLKSPSDPPKHLSHKSQAKKTWLILKVVIAYISGD